VRKLSIEKVLPFEDSRTLTSKEARFFYVIFAMVAAGGGILTPSFHNIVVGSRNDPTHHPASSTPSLMEQLQYGDSE
jgi:hypothetical protein